ncbi:MAG: SUMF1/EgtB/PvdO family nonheme iron enzyme [Phycisphaera sp.]|nr:SUMF1/EgtB/PvdO family nonheme iron enzyme [Phycisphaera sp.]
MEPDSQHLINELQRVGILAPDDAEATISSLGGDLSSVAPAELTRTLARRGVLTEHQATVTQNGQVDTLTIGEYVVLDKIGAGGMGTVYRARHKLMRREVAVKVLPKHVAQDEALVQRFVREVQAAGRLVHPNIVTAFDAGKKDDLIYLVMECVNGKDLGAILTQRGSPLPVEQAIDYVIQAARGLAYAHAQGVIHRDIKPGNLLLSDQGVVKVLDMGLARVESEVGGAGDYQTLTHSEMTMGTAAYMAPEQARDARTADHRADIYSLGCTLYRLLTNTYPYSGDSMVGTLLAHQQSPIPRLPAGFSPHLQHVLDRMLAKDPSERFDSCDALIASLESVLRELRGKSADTAPHIPVAKLARHERDASTGGAADESVFALDDGGDSALMDLAEQSMSPRSSHTPAPTRAGSYVSPKRGGGVGLWIGLGAGLLVIVVPIVMILSNRGVDRPAASTGPTTSQNAARPAGDSDVTPSAASTPDVFTRVPVVRAADSPDASALMNGVELSDSEFPSLPIAEVKATGPNGRVIVTADRDRRQGMIAVGRGGRGKVIAVGTHLLVLHRPDLVEAILRWHNPRPGGRLFLGSTRFQDLLRDLPTLPERYTIEAWSPGQAVSPGDVLIFDILERTPQPNKQQLVQLQREIAQGACLVVDVPLWSRGSKIDLKEVWFNRLLEPFDVMVTTQAFKWESKNGAYVWDEPGTLVRSPDSSASPAPNVVAQPVPQPSPQRVTLPDYAVIEPMDATTVKAKQQSFAEATRVPVEFRNTLDMVFRAIPPGQFSTGDPGETIWPPRTVVVTHGFYMSATEVTFAQFRTFAEATGYKTTAEQTGFTWESGGKKEKGRYWGQPRWSIQDNLPVGNVSLHDAKAFCAWLSEKEGHRYRVPSEAEWEQACRAGMPGVFWFGNDPNKLPDYAWVRDNSGNTPHPVAQKPANPYGLYDTLGNLSEWTVDALLDRPGGYVVDPVKTEGSTANIVSGCNFMARTGPKSGVITYVGFWPHWDAEFMGFRVLLEIDGVK